MMSGYTGALFTISLGWEDDGRTVYEDFPRICFSLEDALESARYAVQDGYPVVSIVRHTYDRGEWKGSDSVQRIRTPENA